jgi:hypothetical protein
MVSVRYCSTLWSKLLIARCMGLQVAIFILDAGPHWIMLRALGLSVHPAQVFASFMLSTLARTLGPMPGGLGIFEAASVATLWDIRSVNSLSGLRLRGSSQTSASRAYPRRRKLRRQNVMMNRHQPRFGNAGPVSRQ